MILNFKVLNILIISNIFFVSNIEIFSVYLSGISFDSFKNVTKNKIGLHRTFARIENKIKTCMLHQYSKLVLLISLSISFDLRRNKNTIYLTTTLYINVKVDLLIKVI